jgi:hypothetical protein
LDRVNVETGNSEDESEKSQVDYLDINEENWLIIIYYNNLLFNNMYYILNLNIRKINLKYITQIIISIYKLLNQKILIISWLKLNVYDK